jgi:sphinganine-1-phosphate aldolase
MSFCSEYRYLWHRPTGSHRRLQAVLLILLKLPIMASKVEPQMLQARQKIEDKLVPSGPHVTRYLSLPPEGQTKEWILEEMGKMDEYCHESGEKRVNWKDGKLSGAVYREVSQLFSL